MIFKSLYSSTLQAPRRWPDKRLWGLLGNKNLAVCSPSHRAFPVRRTESQGAGDEKPICSASSEMKELYLGTLLGSAPPFITPPPKSLHRSVQKAENTAGNGVIGPQPEKPQHRNLNTAFGSAQSVM